MATWALAAAKAKLSEVVEKAVHDEPQQITKNGKPVAMIVSIDEWTARVPQETPKESLAEMFARAGRIGGDEFQIRRIPWKPRRVDLE